MRLALTREISPEIARCELTHLDRAPIDYNRAVDEQGAYEEALRDLGCTVRRLPVGGDFPDSVFIEDTAVVLDEVAVIARPGAESRRGEIKAVGDVLDHFRPCYSVDAPATLDGGDVLRVGKQLYVGVGARTNAQGVAQLRAILAPLRYTVHAVQYRECLHLKSAASLVGPDLVLINPKWVDATVFHRLRTIEIDPSEPFAANALRVDKAVVHAVEFPATRQRLKDAGLTVRSVPAGELAKAEGGVTCCSLIFDAR